MKLLVLGAGAIGGYFGGRLAAAGSDVTFLVRATRRDALQRDGLRVQSPIGDLTLPVKTITADDLAASADAYDLILLTCKAYDLDTAMDAIAPAVHGTCGIVPMLNGMTHLDRLDARFGRAHVLGGTCSLNVGLRADGLVVHTGKLQRLTFGERGSGVTPRAQAFADALAKTPVDWVLSERIEQELWDKLVFLSSLATVACLFRANIREILAAPGGGDAIERTLAANIAIATREGYAPAPAAVQFARSILMNPESVSAASMQRDIEAGNAVESDQIIGWMLERARTHDIDDTMLSLAFTHLKAYEARRAAGRLPQ